jgi:YidC/Oxa1 family membrane protein insertase
VERRHLTFIAVALAIILAGQALQAWLFPPPPRRPGDRVARAAVEPLDRDAAEMARSAEDGRAVAAEAASDLDQPSEVTALADAVDQSPRSRRTIGSLDPADPSRMLVTLTSLGAAVERIELADPRFLDQEDRSGYIGHLAPESVAEGCRLGVVGTSTPADRAGLRSGDVITRIDGLATSDPRTLAAVLSATRPGQRLAVDYLRNGQPASCEVVTARRPLEVVRPEHRATAVLDPDADPHDPMSFLMALEQRDGRGRRDGDRELVGHALASCDWRLESEGDGRSIRFVRDLPHGLSVVKEWRIAPPVADAPEEGYGLDLTVELKSSEGETVVTYALDGPTGLPTEGWWYAQRIGRHMFGGLAVRDVVMRFAGEPSTLVSGLKIADGSLEHPSSAVLEGKPLSFAGVDSLYFASALIPETDGPAAPPLAEVRPRAVGQVPEGPRRKLVDVTPRLVTRELVVTPDAPVVHRYGVFAGPKRPELLRAFGGPGGRMDDLVYYGWFGWVARPLVAVLHGLHAIVGNYGIAIILLTVLVRGAMFPVSRKQALSSQKMQVLQPEMKAIAEKYKNEPEKRTRATQELWRKHNYNPMGGCLLVFIQIPIFMGLYRALATDVELRQAPLFSSAIRWCSNLAAPDMFLDWSRWIPSFLAAPEGWLGPFLNLFPLVTIGLFLWQQKLFMPPAVDEQQKMQQQVMNTMMWFMAVMFFKVPCGLCLYFIASSLWGIAERLWLPVPSPAVPATAASNGSVPTRTGAGVGRWMGEQPVAASPAGQVAEAVRRKRQARKRPR